MRHCRRFVVPLHLLPCVCALLAAAGSGRAAAPAIPRAGTETWTDLPPAGSPPP